MSGPDVHLEDLHERAPLSSWAGRQQQGVSCLAGGRVRDSVHPARHLQVVDVEGAVAMAVPRGIHCVPATEAGPREVEVRLGSATLLKVAFFGERETRVFNGSILI